MAEQAIKNRARRLFELQDIEVKTRSIEEMLSPLIKQVTTLQDNIPGPYRNRRLRNVFKLIQIVDKATDNFTTAAENIAADNPDFQEELWLAIEEVRTAGNLLHEAAHDYTTDVLASRKREAMEGKAAGLLKAVTRLLVLIDLIDISELFKASSRIEAKLVNLKQVHTWEGFVETMKAVTKDIRSVSESAIARQKELKSSSAKQLLVAAHAELSQQAKMLITSTKTFLQHPEDESAIENRDYTIDRLGEVLKTIARLADGDQPEDIQRDLEGSGNEVIPPPACNVVPSSPITPPSSHLYPVEYHVAPPNRMPHSPTASHVYSTLSNMSQTAQSSEDEDTTLDNVTHPLSIRRNRQISDDYDHLQDPGRELGGQDDTLTSQDTVLTYSSSSSFSPYRPTNDPSSPGDVSQRAKFLTGQASSKMYQVSSGTLPTEVQLKPTQITATYDHTTPVDQPLATESAELGKGSGGSSIGHFTQETSLQVPKGEGLMSKVAYPRGHAHSVTISTSTSNASNSNQNSEASLGKLVPSKPTTAIFHSKGQSHQTTTSKSSTKVSLKNSVESAGATAVSQRPTASNMYPREHAHQITGSNPSTASTLQNSKATFGLVNPHQRSAGANYYPKGHIHSVSLTSKSSASTSNRNSEVDLGHSLPERQNSSSSYPREHSHSQMLLSSPTMGFGQQGSYLNLPLKNVEKKLENVETMLEQTIAEPTPSPAKATEELKVGFDVILNAASFIADSDSTRDQQSLLAQCDVVREKFQSLLNAMSSKLDKEDTEQERGEDTSMETETVASEESEEERGEGDGGEDGEEVVRQPKTSTSPGARAIRESAQMVEEETATLRAELRKAMIDHVSDTFVDPCVPLSRMVAAARQGNKRAVDSCSEQFLVHAEKLVHVSNIVCMLTSDGPANREVRIAAKPIESLKQQVVSAAKTLVGHPNSESAQKNMTAFQELWVEKVNALTSAVDKLIPLLDFIAVTEAHIREDSRRLVEAVEVGDTGMTIGSTNVIQGRCDRLMQVVKQDMLDNASRYVPEHAEGLENTMGRMKGKILPGFQQLVNNLCNSRSLKSVYDSDIRNLEDQLQSINDGVRDIRIYVLRTRTKEELKTEPDVDDIISHTSSDLSTSSFVLMDDDFFTAGQPVKAPSPIIKRSSKHGGPGPDVKIEVDIEEVEVTGKEYASMLSYPSNMNFLEGIKEEEEEEDSEEAEVEDHQEEERKRREEEEREREEKEREKAEREAAEKKIMEKAKEEEVRRKNEEMLKKNFQRRSRPGMRKSSSERRLHDERLSLEDEDYVTATGTLRRRLIKRTPSVAVINETETVKDVISQLSVKEQEEIANEQKKLQEEQIVFENEVNQWDDTSNDIIILAKEMCWMVMDMSDFLNGEGQLATAVDVINTAKDITVAAEKFIDLAQQIADLCPEGSSKKDLLAYFDSIKLFCNQLKITSGVMYDLEKIKDTAENVNTLLISSKSLMNTVVQVVKQCYVASNAIKRQGGKLPIEMLQWRLMKPKKRLLYSRESLVQSGEIYKETPRNKEASPIMQLGEFRGRNSVVDPVSDEMVRLMEEKARNVKRHRL